MDALIEAGIRYTSRWEVTAARNMGESVDSKISGARIDGDPQTAAKLTIFQFYRNVVVVVVVYFILSRLLYLAFSANLGLLCMPHPGMGLLV